MSRGRILYYERYDGFGVLIYPYGPFNLAVVWSGKNVFARPIIELPNGECYFLYQGKKLNPYLFELHPDELDPDWTQEWISSVLYGEEIKIDLSNLSDEHLLDFKSMLERKSEKLKQWLLVE
ncbi:hypothetical protein [Spirosoma utsteinense]|uniref:Uncharacterized protein n=1 Tax=Spirosoma utsteinense TaxID=2585773 RepID=A0ABR6W730_9BACT|nr:hypothetical protein [Spirosoma utsteinense]MBC3786205.1 hypothetical protein [Spirosoma utsteinense]MBC3792396.1 hypothetical protein [Spirosoma utsteinense]